MTRRQGAALAGVLCGALLAGALAPLLGWRAMPSRPLGVVLLDKTVPDTTYRGHRVVVWLLNHLKLVHPGSLAPYDAAADYSGFVPLTNRAWSMRPLPSTAGAARVVYIADTYGVSAADLGGRGPGDADRMLAGGLTEGDVAFLEAAARGGATLVAEFNTAADPTTDAVRERANALFGIRWDGWTGRRIRDLARDAPDWARAAWEQQEGKGWEFGGHGLLLVHRLGRVVVLAGSDVIGPGLDILPTLAGEALGMRAAPAPEAWFDLVEPNGAEVLARYRWHLSPRGDSLLAAAGVPEAAAVTVGRVGSARTYYLAGDFANVARIPGWTRLRWGPAFFRALPEWALPADEAFLWRGYLPLLTSILEWSAGG